ncbi:MAG: hypothetical protein PF495_06975 [Spirochaetales bacterium]|jgi:predicted Zn-ribbon and HTH transcriptional regulator|nr:hypothetical protein [Spirochaetales bacterium]
MAIYLVPQVLSLPKDQDSESGLSGQPYFLPADRLLQGACQPEVRWPVMSTIRKQITELLTEKECDARMISQQLGISEKEAYDHLPHIIRSVSATGKTLIVSAPQCLNCGYEFKTRIKLSKPGRGTVCKKERIVSGGRTTLIPLATGILLPIKGIFRGYIAFFTIKKRIIKGAPTKTLPRHLDINKIGRPCLFIDV